MFSLFLLLLLLNLVVGIIQQRAFDATTLISEDDTVRKIKVEWLQSVPSEPLDKERVGTDSRTSDQSEMVGQS